MQRDGSGNFTANIITATLNGNATGFNGFLAGDVIGQQNATVVSYINGSAMSAATVVADCNLAAAATSTNTVNQIVRRDSVGNFSAGTITANLTGNVTGNLTGTASWSTTSTSFSGPLYGDVTGYQSTTSVAAVGGQNSANVGAATVLANAATSTNTANQIVRRDSVGNFSAGTITASLLGNVTGNLTGTAGYFSGPLVGDVTGTEYTTSVAQVGGQSATAVATGAILANLATNTNGQSQIVRRDSVGNFSAGTITASLLGNVTGNLTGTAGYFSGPLVGDVTGTEYTTSVAAVGGQTSASVAAATILANLATNTNGQSQIVRRDSVGNFSAGTITASLLGNVTGNLTGTAGYFSGPLVGDVTGTEYTTSVAAVGGQTSASVAAATILANLATNTNGQSQIVRRDSSGNFSAGTITASLLGNVTGNLTGTASWSTTSTSFSGPLSGDVTGYQSTTSVAAVGGQNSANVGAATVLANAATSTNTANQIVRRDSVRKL